MIDNKDNLYLIDFCLASEIKNKIATFYMQTIYYRAPEVMLGMKQYGYGIDIWAVGCVFA